jgi:protease PrsW
MSNGALPIAAVATPMFQPRSPAFWVYCLALVGGAYATAAMAINGWRVMPVSVLAGLAAWVLYTLPLLWLFRRLGVFRGQTASVFVMAFAWGGLGAVYLALPANQAVFGILSKMVGPAFTHHWGPAIAGPSDEEPLKLIGVILLVLMAPARFRSITSVMAVGALVGLGFQVVEDFFYTVSGAVNHPNADQLEPVTQMIVLRGLFCGLWSHAAYTTVASFGVGYFVARPNEPLAKRWLVAVAAFAVAWSLHAFWNSPLLTEMTRSIWVLLYFPLKGVPVLLAVYLLSRVARSERAAA